MSTLDKVAGGIISCLLAANVVIALRGDQAGAGIASIYPDDDGQPPITASIRIAFSQPMQSSSVLSRFSIQPPVEGSPRWDGNTFIFTPLARLQKGQAYTVTLTAGSSTQMGRLVRANTQWTFTPRSPEVLYLFPANSSPQSLWIASPEAGSPRRVFNPEQSIDSFSPSPDGTRIVVALNGGDQSADLWMVDRNGSNASQIIDCHPDYCGGPAWSPDGRFIAFERRYGSDIGESGSNRIWLYDTMKGAAAPLLQDEEELGFDAVWSVDSHKLAYFDPGRAAIRVVNVGSGSAVNITSQMGQTGTFSPDGTTMVFTDVRPVGGQFFASLWQLSLDGVQQPSPLAISTEEDQYPAWSPVDNVLAFGRRLLDRSSGMGTQLMLLDWSKNRLEQITYDRNTNTTAFEWSPDGDMIVMERFPLGTDSGTSEIWVYQRSTGKLKKIADEGHKGAWIP